MMMGEYPELPPDLIEKLHNRYQHPPEPWPLTVGEVDSAWATEFQGMYRPGPLGL